MASGLRTGSRSIAWLLPAVAITLAVAAAPASAATLKVPQQFATIQLAEDAAQPGDVIRIRPGVYNEAVAVDVENLRIVGDDRAKVIVDADGDSDPGFGVTSNNVTIETLTVRNSDEQGIECLAQGCTVRNVAVSGNTGNECVSITGDDAVVQSSRLAGCDSDGILVDGADARIASNSVRLIASVCIAVVGSQNAVVQNNVIQNCTNQGIFAGNGSDNTRIDRNTIRAVGEDGVEMEAGDTPDVTRNRVEAPTGDGFDIDCAGACSDGRVESNLVVGLPTTDAGYDLAVIGALPGFSIARNVAVRVGGPGFDLDVSDAVITRNRVSRSGAADDNAFFLSGNDNVFSSNTADANGGDGVVVDGDGNDLLNNLSQRNHLNGFEVLSASNDTLVQRNVARNNRATGIENDGTNTDVIDNKASGNQTDCENNGSIDVDTGNKCADGSTF